MRIYSKAFSDGGWIDERFTCRGDNKNPPIEIYDIPAGAETLALIMVDLDTPYENAHWLIWNMDTATPVIHEGYVPNEASEGANDFGTLGYHGPCPEDDTIHRYQFTAYALSDEMALSGSYEKHDLLEAMEDITIATASMVGKYDGG